MRPSVRVFADPLAAAAAAADRLVALSEPAVAARGSFRLAVSGGRTPEPMFSALARRPDGAARWSAWELFWCDERMVPPDDPRSNFGAAQRLWLGPAAFPASNVHPVDTTLGLVRAAEAYEAAVRRGTEGPGFDVVALGIGPDGHTASLFPGSPGLAVADRWVVAEPGPALPPAVPRVTLTLRSLCDARVAVFLVSGADKRNALSEILAPATRHQTAATLPAARVRAREGVEWFVDRAAAPVGLEGAVAG